MFRFTIRDVLWLVLVSAVGLSWLVSDRRRIAEREFLVVEHAKRWDRWNKETERTLRHFLEGPLSPLAAVSPAAQQQEADVRINHWRAAQERWDNLPPPQ